MNFDSAALVYFSPTQTTKKVLESIVHGLQVERVEHLDLTPPSSKAQGVAELRAELAIIGAPVYGGRIPLEAAHRLQRIKGHNTLAVIVAVYGNRAYEDALLEIKDIVASAGFVPVAGGAFIGEHSFSTDALPIAPGRPDAEDAERAAAFGKMIRDKLSEVRTLAELSPLHVPGQSPYRERPQDLGQIAPISQETLCAECKTCIRVCPTAAITWQDKAVTDVNACILCCACVKACPTGAKVMDHPRINKSRDWLSKNCSVRKEPEIYL
jgi:ferredoxin